MGEPRLFTHEEAERTLPFVSRIVHDLMEEHPGWRRAVARYELLAASARADAREPAGLREAEREVAGYASRIDGFLDELAQVGCVFKGFEDGLVDFHAMHEGRVVCLCWRYGEPRITHWHELDAGFAGRQPWPDPSLTEIES